MKKLKGKIKVVFEKTDTGYSAYSEKCGVYTTGSNIEDLRMNLIESLNFYYEDFGYERFENIILQNKDKSLDEITSVLMHDLTLFSKDHSQHDDITLVLIKWTKKN